MARHRTLATDPDPEPQLDISSLIDVCFLLLIYFLVTSTIIPSERDLPLKLPVPTETATPVAIDPLFLRVDESGAVFTGTGNSERPMDSDPSDHTLPLLSGHLELYRAAADAAGERPLVQLWIDPEARQQRVIDVLNSLAAAKITDVTFTDLVDTL